VHCQPQRFPCQLFADARDLKEDTARLDDRHPVFGGSLTGTHAGFSGFGRHRLMGENFDPNLTASFNMAGQGNTRCFYLVAGNPARLHRHKAEFTVTDKVASQGFAFCASALNAAVFHSFW
jgi:hypothetical protein